MRGLLLISHDLGVVGAMADEIAVMRRGEIVEAGPAAGLFQQHAEHPYSQALAGGVLAYRPPGVAACKRRALRLLEVNEVVREYPLRPAQPVRDQRRAPARGRWRQPHGPAGRKRRRWSASPAAASPRWHAPCWRLSRRRAARSGSAARTSPAWRAAALTALRRRCRWCSRIPMALSIPATAPAASWPSRCICCAGRCHRARARGPHRGRAGRGRAVSRRRRQVPARVLWRSAPAPRHRPRADHPAGAHRSRRARLRARRLGPGPDPRPAGRSAGSAWAWPTVHLARPRGRPRHHRPGRGHAAGRVVEEGATAQVLDAPKHAYSRALVASALHLDKVLAERTAGYMSQTSTIRHLLASSGVNRQYSPASFTGPAEMGVPDHKPEFGDPARKAAGMPHLPSVWDGPMIAPKVEAVPEAVSPKRPCPQNSQARSMRWPWAKAGKSLRWRSRSRVPRKSKLRLLRSGRSRTSLGSKLRPQGRRHPDRRGQHGVFQGRRRRYSKADQCRVRAYIRAVSPERSDG